MLAESNSKNMALKNEGFGYDQEVYIYKSDLPTEKEIND